MKIIPIFIPHAGCPYNCVYCDQHRISGAGRMPTIKEIQSIIRRNLKTIPKDEKIEVAFFGGTFTFLPEELQGEYLDAVVPFIKKGFVKNIRISTHPEAVDLRSMKRFKRRGGRLVELGIQSLDKDVLKVIKRETDFNTVRDAAGCIRKAGLKLGVQVMLGLPGDSLEKSVKTAKRLVTLKPETARIYPTLVIKGTQLAALYKKGRYKPLESEEAVEQAAEITDIFENAGIKVIRIGLHPSRDLDSRNAMLAGPYHRAFGEMVRARQMRNKIVEAVRDKFVANRSHIEIQAPKNMFNLISGHKKSEKRFIGKYFGVPFLLRKGRRVVLKDIRKDIAIGDPRMPRKAKEKLQKLNYYVAEVLLHERLQRAVSGHADMMLFRYKDRIIYEPRLENIAEVLRQNGYNCVRGESISSPGYPKDIIYNACVVDRHIIHYKGSVEKKIKGIKTRHVLVNQGYAKCSIVPIDKKHIITSDRGIKDVWERNGGIALLIRPGYVKLPGYKTGFIRGASGVSDKTVFFVGRLNSHPDGRRMMDFIRGRDKGIIELYKGPLYDVGTVTILPCLSKTRVLY